MFVTIKEINGYKIRHFEFETEEEKKQFALPRGLRGLGYIAQIAKLCECRAKVYELLVDSRWDEKLPGTVLQALCLLLEDDVSITDYIIRSLCSTLSETSRCRSLFDTYGWIPEVVTMPWFIMAACSWNEEHMNKIKADKELTDLWNQVWSILSEACPIEGWKEYQLT